MGRYVDFRQEAYISNLKKAFERVLDQVARDVYLSAINNLSQLKVRNIDAPYAHTFPAALKMTNKDVVNRLVRHFGVDNSVRNQHFRVLYYEYGTGAHMRPPATWSPGGVDWNPVRPAKVGAPIYYRDRPWVDLGGNPHKGSVKLGVKKMIPRKSPYGQPVRAQFWFQRALKQGIRNLDSLILQAVKSVPITAYIKLRNIRVRM